MGESERLIELVRNYPILHDTARKDHWAHNKRAEAWTEIATQLSLPSGDAAKKKWKALRELHTAYLRAQSDTTSKDSKRYKHWQDSKRYKHWHLASQMEFLEQHGTSMQTDENERLIDCVRNYPILYDAKREDYRDNVKKAEAWTKIAAELSITNGDVAKSIWQYLRGCYTKCLQAQAGTTNSDDTKRYKHWRLANKMEFLKQHVTPRHMFESERLIEIVQNYPMLYNAKSEGYRDNVKKAKTWTKIAVELSLHNGDVAKERWRNLRRTYSTYLQAQSNTASEDSKRYKHWHLANQMEFLKHHVTPSK